MKKMNKYNKNLKNQKYLLNEYHTQMDNVGLLLILVWFVCHPYTQEVV